MAEETPRKDRSPAPGDEPPATVPPPSPPADDTDDAEPTGAPNTTSSGTDTSSATNASGAGSATGAGSGTTTSSATGASATTSGSGTTGADSTTGAGSGTSASGTTGAHSTTDPGSGADARGTTGAGSGTSASGTTGAHSTTDPGSDADARGTTGAGSGTSASGTTGAGSATGAGSGTGVSGTTGVGGTTDSDSATEASGGTDAGGGADVSGATGAGSAGGVRAGDADATGEGSGAAGGGGTTADAGGTTGGERVPAVVERTVVEKTTVQEDVAATPDPAHDLEQRKIEAGVDHRFPFGRPGEPLGRAHPFVFGFVAALGVITAWQLFNAALNAKSVLVMITVAMFLAVGLNPAVERLRRVGLPRGLAVGMVFLGVILFFAGFVASLVQPVSEQTTELRKNIPGYVKQLQENERLAEWDKRYGLLDRAEKTVNSEGFQDQLTSWATGIGKVAVNGLFQTLTILILTLYFLSSLPQIKTFFYRLAPRSRRARVALLGDEILDRIGGYVAGQFTIAFIAGLTTYIFLSIIGMKYALALALIVAVTDLIPLIGATIGAVVVTLVAFLTGSLTDGIVCIVFYIIYQQVENYLVYPRVMKRTVDVQPAVTIVAALIGGALLGVVGALLAIPTAASIALLIREVVVPRQETM
ncbi:AI-2E family transporter [Actinomadura fulvescens]|uniref:AI-2E family transporter n=1 Tax=Actinomadura fulvescens TaxID=46160 RepID=UPI003978DBCD